MLLAYVEQLKKDNIGGAYSTQDIVDAYRNLPQPQGKRRIGRVGCRWKDNRLLKYIMK
jgi:hypothetical protein